MLRYFVALIAALTLFSFSNQSIYAAEEQAPALNFELIEDYNYILLKSKTNPDSYALVYSAQPFGMNVQFLRNEDASPPNSYISSEGSWVTGPRDSWDLLDSWVIFGAYPEPFSVSNSLLNLYQSGTPEQFNNNIIGRSEEPYNPEEEDLAWYERAISTVQGWFGGILDTLATPFTALADGVAGLGNKLSGVWESIKGIPNAILEGIKGLFIPSEEFSFMDGIINALGEKFPFITDIEEAVNSVVVSGGDTSSPPTFKANVYGVETELIDFTWYAPYRSLVNTVLVAFAWAWFGMSLFRRAPSIIGGFRGDSIRTSTGKGSSDDN